MAVDFLRLLLTQWTRDRADFDLEKVENRQNIHQNVHEKWENPGMLVFNLKDLIVIIKKLEVIKLIHFWGGGGWGGGEIRVIETKVVKFARCSLSFIFLQFYWLLLNKP